MGVEYIPTAALFKSEGSTVVEGVTTEWTAESTIEVMSLSVTCYTAKFFLHHIPRKRSMVIYPPPLDFMIRS